MSEEIWKDIEGYEGLYQVSSWGRIKSLYHNKEKILCQVNCNGYYSVHLVKYNKLKNYYVHRLVAKTFVPNPQNLPEVGHKDEKSLRNSNECNNSVDNLEWTTHRDNNNTPMHRKRSSDSRKGKSVGGNNPRAKKVECEGIIFDCIKDCARYYEVCYTLMLSRLTGNKPMSQKWIDRGLKYVDE